MRRVFYRVSCKHCDYFLTFEEGRELNMFMLSAPACIMCSHKEWRVTEREYGSVYDQDEDETEFVPHPIPFSEDAIKHEVDACMGELQLYLMSDAGKLAEQRAKFDPKGPWAS